MTPDKIWAWPRLDWKTDGGSWSSTELPRSIEYTRTAAIEPIAPPDVGQAARVLLDVFNTDAVDKGCDAAQEEHAAGDAGEANDIVEAFLRAIAALP